MLVAYAYKTCWKYFPDIRKFMVYIDWWILMLSINHNFTENPENNRFGVNVTLIYTKPYHTVLEIVLYQC